MDDTFPFVNEAASEHVGTSLQDLSQHGHTGNGNTLLSRADEATTNSNPITRLNLNERTRRQLLEDVLRLLAQNSGSTERDKEYPISADSHTHMEQSDINQDMSSRPKMSTSQGQSGYQDSTSQSQTQITLVLSFRAGNDIKAKIDLKFQSDCATMNASFTMSTSYKGSLLFLNWGRTDIIADITITMPNETTCDVSPTPDYDLAKYAFECSSKQGNYAMTINRVQDEDIGVNWTVTISTETEILLSNTVQVELCDSAASNQEEKDGRSYILIAVLIVVVFVAAFVSIVIVKFIPNKVTRITRNAGGKVNELIYFIGVKGTGKQPPEGDRTGSTKTNDLDSQTSS